MNSVFRLQRTATEWLNGEGFVLLTWAIFNPNGPTVSCVGLRATGARGQQEVFYRWLHFLGGQDYNLGYLGPQSSGQDLLAILRNAFSLQASEALPNYRMVTCVPSLFRTNLTEALTGPCQEIVLGSPAVIEADWGRERYLLDRYHTDLFDRAGEELREAVEDIRRTPDFGAAAEEGLRITEAMHNHIPTFRDWVPGRYEGRGLQDGDLEAWLGEVTTDEFWILGSALLAEAWVQAPKRGQLETVTPLSEVLAFFEHYQFPWWPTEFKDTVMARLQSMK